MSNVQPTIFLRLHVVHEELHLLQSKGMAMQQIQWWYLYKQW